MSVSSSNPTSTVYGRTTETVELNKQLSVILDDNGYAVLRIVDAAPFGYDSTNGWLKIDIASIVNANSNSGLTGLADAEMPIVVKAKTIANLKYLYPLQEPNSRVAYDLSTNVYHAQKSNIATLNTDGLNSPRRVAIFRSAGDSYIRLPKVCTIKNLAAFSWFGVVNIASQGAAKKLYNETTSNDSAAGRFQVVLNTDLKLTVNVRSGISSQTPLAFTSTNAIPTGYHMILATVDVATSAITAYVDGIAIAGSTTGSLSPDTAIANTDPKGQIYVGTNCASDTTPTTPTYIGNMAYIGLYERVITLTEIQDLAIAGGFMSLDRA